MISSAIDQLIRQRGQRISFHDQQVVIQQGHFAECMYMVDHGQLEVLIDQQVVAVLQQGDFFGEYALFSESRTHTASVRACMMCNLIQVCF